MLDRTEEYTKMAAVERHLWWYCSLHHLVLDTITEARVGRNSAIVDAGCGTGGLIQFLHEKGFPQIKGFDLSTEAVEIARRRNLNVQQGDLRQIATLYPHSSIHVVVSNDTLYFFDVHQQADIVNQCWQILRPGGLLILNVPALKAFSGIHDLSVGVKMRFSRMDTPRLLNPARFQIVRELYWPFVISPLIFAVRLAQRIRMRTNPNFEIRSDIDLPPAWMNRLFLRLTLLENRAFKGNLFGSSLFLVGKRKEESIHGGINNTGCE